MPKNLQKPITVTENQKETECEIIHAYSPDRVAVMYDGALVLADQKDGIWELSSKPVRKEEKEVWDRLMSVILARGTTTTVTAPGGKKRVRTRR